MKFFIASAFLFLLIAQPILSQQWETLSDDAYDEIPILSSLRTIGASYVQQKGKYESTKAPLPGKHYVWSSDYPGKVERQNASDVTYYRFSLPLIEELQSDGSEGDSLVNSTFTVSYRTSNHNFLVTSYRYTLDSDGNAPDPDEEEAVVDFDGTSRDYLDLRPFNNGSSDLSDLLNEATDRIVDQAIENGDLPDSDYTIRYVYEAYIFQTDAPIYKTLKCAVKLVNSDGDYYLVHIEADHDFDDESAEEEDINPYRYDVLIPA